MTQGNEDDLPKRQAIRAQIDENLKRVYTTALNEELPDRFRDLLAQLQAKGSSSNDRHRDGDCG